MNVVCLAGNVTKQPELRTAQSGTKVCRLGLAMNEGKDKTEFIDLIAFDKTGELINQYVNKGDRLSLQGALATSSWEADGVKKYKTEVIIRSFDFPPKKTEAPMDSPMSAPAGEPNMDDFDDEIPF